MMTTRSTFIRRIACLVAAGLWGTLSALAFANAPIGSVVENVLLPALAGSPQYFLSDTNLSVFIFIKPGLAHSNQALANIAKLEKEMADQPVHWCAIVSDRIPKADVEAEVQASGISMPVLIDPGDALYGKLGVILHPVVGITDSHHRLIAYQPFAEVNYVNFIRAQIRHGLGEISDEELADALQPTALPLSGDVSVAHRFLRLAEKQFQSTNYVQALTNVQRSLDKNATAAAFALQGQILAAQGQTSNAITAFDAALKLDPNDAAAVAGRKGVNGAIK